MTKMDRDFHRAYVEAGMAPIGPYVAEFSPDQGLFEKALARPRPGPVVRRGRWPLVLGLVLATGFLALMEATKPAGSAEFYRRPGVAVIVVPGYGVPRIEAGEVSTDDVLHESPAETAARQSEWEARCGTTLYVNPKNYARAAVVARRCGGRLR